MLRPGKTPILQVGDVDLPERPGRVACRAIGRSSTGSTSRRSRRERLFRSDDDQLRDGRRLCSTTRARRRPDAPRNRGREPPNYFVRDLPERRQSAGHRLQGSASADHQRDGEPHVRHLQAQGRRRAERHDLPARPAIKKGAARADARVGVSARVRRRRRGQPGRRIAESLHDGRRLVAPAAADAGLRDLRRPDDADRRPGRDGERHLRRAARGERAGGDRQGRRARHRRPRIASASAATATARS